MKERVLTNQLMRPLGSVLMVGGLVLGVGVGVAIIGGFHFGSMPWIVSVGLAKLTLLASAGLMGAGAVCHRLAVRDEQRRSPLQAPDADRNKLR